jgi:hypothetical protein
MSITPHEAAEEAAYEALVDQLYDEHREQAFREFIADEALMEEIYEKHRERAIEEFTVERLTSFYEANPLVAQPPCGALAESKMLLAEGHTTGAQVFAAVAIEVGLKSVLLKPVVHGLICGESTAEIISDLALRHTRFDFLHRLLAKILQEHGGVDLETYIRPGAAKKLLCEISEVQKCRDRLLHRAETASPVQAKQAIAVAEAILEQLFPTVMKKLGLHLHEGPRICWGYCEARRAERLQRPTTPAG